MTTEQTDGGRAFPLTCVNANGFHETFPGMSLRDWFAGLAMQGMLASESAGDGMCKNYTETQTMHESTTEEAFKRADAMLKERVKREKRIN